MDYDCKICKIENNLTLQMNFDLQLEPCYILYNFLPQDKKNIVLGILYNYLQNNNQTVVLGILYNFLSSNNKNKVIDILYKYLSNNNQNVNPETIYNGLLDNNQNAVLETIVNHLPNNNKNVVLETIVNHLPNQKQNTVLETIVDNLLINNQNANNQKRILETIVNQYPKMFFLFKKQRFNSKFIFLNKYLDYGTIMGSYNEYNEDFIKKINHKSKRIKITPEMHCIPPEIRNQINGDDTYKKKYLKYKLKYVKLKQLQTGGSSNGRSLNKCANKWFIDVGPFVEKKSNNKRWILLKDSPEFTRNYLELVPIEKRKVFFEWDRLFNKFPNQIKFLKLEESCINISDDYKKNILFYQPTISSYNNPYEIDTLYGFIHRRNENYMRLYLTIPHFRLMCQVQYLPFYKNLKQKLIDEYYPKSKVINLDIYHRVTPAYYNRGYVVMDIYHRDHDIIIEDSAFERFSRYELDDILYLYNVWHKKTFVCRVPTNIIHMSDTELDQHIYRGVACMKKLYDDNINDDKQSIQHGNGDQKAPIYYEIKDKQTKMKEELAKKLNFFMGTNKIIDYKNKKLHRLVDIELNNFKIIDEPDYIIDNYSYSFADIEFKTSEKESSYFKQTINPASVLYDIPSVQTDNDINIIDVVENPDKYKPMSTYLSQLDLKTSMGEIKLLMSNLKQYFNFVQSNNLKDPNDISDQKKLDIFEDGDNNVSYSAWFIDNDHSKIRENTNIYKMLERKINSNQDLWNLILLLEKTEKHIRNEWNFLKHSNPCIWFMCNKTGYDNCQVLHFKINFSSNVQKLKPKTNSFSVYREVSIFDIIDNLTLGIDYINYKFKHFGLLLEQFTKA